MEDLKRASTARDEPRALPRRRDRASGKGRDQIWQSITHAYLARDARLVSWLDGIASCLGWLVDSLPSRPYKNRRASST